MRFLRCRNMTGPVVGEGREKAAAGPDSCKAWNPPGSVGCSVVSGVVQFTVACVEPCPWASWASWAVIRRIHQKNTGKGPVPARSRRSQQFGSIVLPSRQKTCHRSRTILVFFGEVGRLTTSHEVEWSMQCVSPQPP